MLYGVRLMTEIVKRFTATIGRGRQVLRELDGAGDVVREIVKVGSFGLVGPCAGCEDRREDWNRRFPNPFASSSSNTPTDRSD